MKEIKVYICNTAVLIKHINITFLVEFQCITISFK